MGKLRFELHFPNLLPEKSFLEQSCFFYGAFQVMTMLVAFLKHGQFCDSTVLETFLFLPVDGITELSTEAKNERNVRQVVSSGRTRNREFLISSIPLAIR